MGSKLSRYCEGLIEAAWLAAVIVIPLFFNVVSSRIFEPDKISKLEANIVDVRSSRSQPDIVETAVVVPEKTEKALPSTLVIIASNLGITLPPLPLDLHRFARTIGQVAHCQSTMLNLPCRHCQPN